jgi:EmrB/QacA subfamily drug resistance transporter
MSVIAGRRRWVVLAVLSAVAFMAQLDLFIVNIGLPQMARSFGTEDLAGLSWVLNAYAIVFAALLVPAGRLADHFGRRRFLLSGLLVFTLASALCAAAPDLAVIVIGRAIQAIGAAMIVPTSLGLLLPTFEPRQHNLVVGIWAGVAAIAAALGPPVGGLLVALDWRWMFILNLPIGAATLVAGLLVLPEIRADKAARLPDRLSIVALLAAVTVLTYGTIQGPAWGWTSGREGLLLLAFLVSAGITLWRIIAVEHAVIERRLFSSRQFTAATVALFLFYLGFAAWLLSTALFFTDQWGYGVVHSGLALIPGPVASAIFAVNSGRLVHRFGRRTLATVGPTLFVIAALYWLFITPATSHYWYGFMPGLVIGGASAGMTQAPLFASASALPADRATTGSAVLNMSRQIGSALGVAILVALMATATPHELALFQRGWIFMAIVAGATAVAAVIGLPGKPAPDVSPVRVERRIMARR